MKSLALIILIKRQNKIKKNGEIKMLKIQFAKKVDTTVKTIEKGLKPESEKKKKYDYSTYEELLENKLSYKENEQEILNTIKL